MDGTRGLGEAPKHWLFVCAVSRLEMHSANKSLAIVGAINSSPSLPLHCVERTNLLHPDKCHRTLKRVYQLYCESTVSFASAASFITDLGVPS